MSISPHSKRPSLGALVSKSSGSGGSSFTMPQDVSYSRVAEKDGGGDVELNSGDGNLRTAWSGGERRSRGCWGIGKYLLLGWNVLLLLIIAALGSQALREGNLERCRVWPEEGTRVDQWQPTIKPTLFMNNSRFANGEMWSSLSALEAILANWVPLSNRGRGLIKIDPADRTGLDPPYILDPLNTNTPQEVYMLSSPHQLHCLSTIMYSYGKLRSGGDETHMGEHVAHCFDYLRQGIMCGGDVTLEGNASHRFPGRTVEVPWGAMHMCRDWEEVKEWADAEGRVVWEFPKTLTIL